MLRYTTLFAATISPCYAYAFYTFHAYYAAAADAAAFAMPCADRYAAAVAAAAATPLLLSPPAPPLFSIFRR